MLGVHSRCGLHTRAATNSWHAYPKASDISSPPCLLRLLPAGADAGWDLHPLENAALHGARDTQPPIPTFRSRFDPSRICFVPSNRRPAAGTSRIAVLRNLITSALILVILDCPKWRRGIAARPGTISPVRSTCNGLRRPSAAPLTDVFSIRLSFPTVGFPQIARRTGPPTASS